MNQSRENNDESNINNLSQRTSSKSDNDIKKNRKIIADYFRTVNAKKNLSHEIIKSESINFLNSLNRDITQIYDQDKNSRKFYDYH